MRNAFLIGRRLYLRPLELEDADLVRGWLNDPEVRRFLRINAPLNRLAEEAFIRGLTERRSTLERVLVVVLREGERPIGTVGLHDVAPACERTATVGIAIGEKDCWGQGYGAEALGLLLEHAFDELNLHRVGLTVYAHNPRALACYEKLGFVREGAWREAHFVDGRYVDEVLMGILAREWRERRA